MRKRVLIVAFGFNALFIFTSVTLGLSVKHFVALFALAATGVGTTPTLPDLLVCGLHGLKLYRNRGNGTFADVTKSAGLDNRGRWSVGAVWLDIDNDGDLDLFVVNYVRWDPAFERECRVNGKVDFCHPRF